MCICFRHEESEFEVNFETGSGTSFVFCACAVIQGRKRTKVFLKMPLESLFSRAYMLFDTGNPNLRSIFKAEVVIMVLLRMRNNKVDTVNPNLKCILKPDKVCFRADAKVFFSRLGCRTSGPF